MGKMRWVVVLVLVLAGAQGSAWATCGICQVCQTDTNVTFARDFCRIASSENGSMCCSEQAIGPQTFCSESGTPCYGIVVGDGGGWGGSGGGGGNNCGLQNGWCPAECWSCSGGGGGGVN